MITEGCSRKPVFTPPEKWRLKDGTTRQEVSRFFREANSDACSEDIAAVLGVGEYAMEIFGQDDASIPVRTAEKLMRLRKLTGYAVSLAEQYDADAERRGVPRRTDALVFGERFYRGRTNAFCVLSLYGGPWKIFTRRIHICNWRPVTCLAGMIPCGGFLTQEAAEYVLRIMSEVLRWKPQSDIEIQRGKRSRIADKTITAIRKWQNEKRSSENVKENDQTD